MIILHADGIEFEEKHNGEKYRVGFANLNEANEYAVAVRASLEALTAPGDDIDLIVRDNALDDDHALANAAEFAAMPVDLVIMYHINERLSGKIRSILRTTPISSALLLPIFYTSQGQNSTTLSST